MMDELTSLVLAAQRGDLKAFTTLVMRFQDMAFATAYAVLGDACQAEDSAQEAFLEAYINLNKLETPVAFPGWFRTIVLRQVSRLTRRKRVATVPLEYAFEVADASADIVAYAEQQEMRADVLETIASLPEHERQVTLLFYIGNHTQQEIADYLGVRVATVKSRLHTARSHMRERMMQMVQANLQEQRPSKDARFVQEVIEVIQATEAGDRSKLEALLERNPALAKAKDERPGATALHYAAWSGQQEIAELLLAYGADIDLHDDKHDAPPIGWAGENGQHAMFDFLLQKGAKLDIGHAAAYGALSLVQSFLQKDPGLANFGTGKRVEHWSPLWQAAFWKRSEFVDLLLAAGADVNAPTRRGETPLHGAVLGGDVEIVERLLASGADLNATADNGMTPLHRAVWQRSRPLVETLLAHNARTDLHDQYGHTPLRLASATVGVNLEGWGEVDSTDPRLVKLLKAHGAQEQ